MQAVHLNKVATNPIGYMKLMKQNEQFFSVCGARDQIPRPLCMRGRLSATEPHPMPPPSSVLFCSHSSHISSSVSCGQWLPGWTVQMDSLPDGVGRQSLLRALWAHENGVTPAHRAPNRLGQRMQITQGDFSCMFTVMHGQMYELWVQTA